MAAQQFPQPQPQHTLRGEARLVAVERGTYYVELDLQFGSPLPIVLLHGKLRPIDGEAQSIGLHGAAFLMQPGETISVQIGPVLGVYSLVLGKLHEVARHGLEMNGVQTPQYGYEHKAQ